ncbi:MAG: galactokinase [Maribacter sp.]|jgi:galactokinase
MIKSEVEAFFIKKYRSKPILVKAPGRVNIIGEHTDYNLGYVLPASIEKGIYFAAQKNNTDKINIETFLTQPEQIVFRLDASHHPFTSLWGNYFKAILEILLEKDYPLIGFDCVFGGDIPIGAGLSSSAALCCGFIHAFAELGGFEIARKDSALIAQKAEHKIGLNCGIMDQYAVLFGKKGNALFLDCKDISYEYVPINFKGYSWVLINSNITHNLAVDSEYNKRRNSCELVVSEVAKFKSNAHSLRDISFEDLEKIKSDVSPVDYKRARYILAENGRVIRMMDALEKGDAKQSGAILLEGHWAMSTEYEITTGELDLLVSTGQRLGGVMGSRMMGGGFGGCTINLIKTELMEAHSKAILATYKKETGIDAEVYHLKIDDGVRTLAH